jgi:hypothetical protein
MLYISCMAKTQTAIRIESDILKRLEEIAENEKKKTGFSSITKSDIINKALKEFCDKYKG